MKLAYAIKYVADMNRAVKFYRDVLGLQLKFESPEWSEFATGETTLALHPATAKHSAGAVELGFTVTDIQNSHKDLGAKGVASAFLGICTQSAVKSRWIRRNM
jgi:lactoylglutathione lyase